MLLFTSHTHKPLRSRVSFLSRPFNIPVLSLFPLVSCPPHDSFVLFFISLWGLGFRQWVGRKKKRTGPVEPLHEHAKAMAVFRHVYKIPNDVRLRYVHWSDALNPLTGDLLILVVAIVAGGSIFPWPPCWRTSLATLGCPPLK